MLKKEKSIINDEEYIIIGDLHGDIDILLNILNNVFDLKLTIEIIENNKKNIEGLLINIIKSNKIIVLLGDIFDCWHEIYDINNYEYNKYNNIYLNENEFEEYKNAMFNKTYDIIKLFKSVLKEKLILILGNHDIRYYKKYDISNLNKFNLEIINEIKEYLIYINENFILNYDICKIIRCIHYYEYNNKNKLNLLNYIDNNEKLQEYILKISEQIESEKQKPIKNHFKYIYIKGHTSNMDYIINKKYIFLDNRMSKFKYNLNKCLLNNCYNVFVYIKNNKNNQIQITKYNNFKKVYKIIIDLNKYFINFYNNFYLKNINDNQKIYLNNNIKNILMNDNNELSNELNNLNITNYNFINQSMLNNICMINEKLNFYYNMNNYNNIKDMNIKNNNYTYIYDEKLNNIGRIYFKDRYLNIIGGNDNILLNEINDNYKLFINNNNNKNIIGKANYKSYIPQCIKNYNNIIKLLENYNFNLYNMNSYNEDYIFLVCELFRIFYNYNLSKDEFINFDNKNINSSNNLISPKDDFDIRLFNICYGIDNLYINNIGFNNILDIIMYISAELYVIDDMINYKLIELCYKIVKKEDYNKKTILINLLTNKIKHFNNQQNQPYFLINNMIYNYDDKFYNNDFDLKYITQLNIYALYYIYNLNLNQDLNNEIKLFLNI